MTINTHKTAHDLTTLLTYNHNNIFLGKLKEIFDVIITDKISPNSIVCKTLKNQLESAECTSFFKYASLANRQTIMDVFMLCSDAVIDNSDIHVSFVIHANKLCKCTNYNEFITHKLNSDVDFLLNVIKIDSNAIKALVNKDENYYVDLFNFVDRCNVNKIFKSLPAHIHTPKICKCALHNDYTCIKYINNVTLDMCNTAVGLGHDNLGDISPTCHTKDICRLYIKIDRKNLKKLTVISDVPFDIVEAALRSDIRYISMIDSNIILDAAIYTYMISLDGTLIRYIKPTAQTLRLFELAIAQNKNAKYYATYKCNHNINNTNIVHNLHVAIDDVIRAYGDIIKKHKLEHKIFKSAIVQNYEMSFNSGILMSVAFDENMENITSNNNLFLNHLSSKSENAKQVRFHVMSAENYINYQYRSLLEERYPPKFNVLNGGTRVYSKSSSNSPKTKIEICSLLSDCDNNDNKSNDVCNLFVAIVDFYI